MPIRQFLNDEQGGAIIEYGILTAAVIGLSSLMFEQVEREIVNIARELSVNIQQVVQTLSSG